jgi:hypothetical protein
MNLWNFIKQLVRLAFAAWWNKVTENYPEIDSLDAPKYDIESPEKYTRNYFTNDLTDHTWAPEYKQPINHLYDNDNSIYEKRKISLS